MARLRNTKGFKDWLTSVGPEFVTDLLVDDFRTAHINRKSFIHYAYSNRNNPKVLTYKPDHKRFQTHRPTTPTKYDPNPTMPDIKPAKVALAINGKFTGEKQHLDQPYTISEASRLYEADGYVSGTVLLPADDLCDRLGEDFRATMAELLIDGNTDQIKDDLDVEVAGCDMNGLYFNVTCHADPCKDGLGLE